MSIRNPRINLTLPEKLNKRLEDLSLKIAQRKGRIDYAAKVKICRKALEEWLDAHEDDDIQEFTFLETKET